MLWFLALAATVFVTGVVTGVEQASMHAVARHLGLASAGPAVRVSARYDWLGEDAIVFVFGQPLSGRERARIGAMTTGDMQGVLGGMKGVQVALPDWRGGRFGTFTRVKVVVQNRASTPVVLTGMRAQVSSRGAPLKAAQVALLPQGDETVSAVAFDLDSKDPVARVEGAKERIGAPYFVTHDVTLAENESVVFEAQAFTSRFYVEWSIVIQAVIDGRTRRLVVDADGRPFRSSALASSYRSSYGYDYASQKFVKATSAPAATLNQRHRDGTEVHVP